MKLLAVLLILLTVGCTTTIPQNCLIMYHQVDCKGKYTHTYWYTGKVFEYPRAEYPGMVISDQKEANEYLGKDVSINTFQKFDNIPWGCYNVMIGGYVMHGESGKDCVYVVPARIEDLP